MSDDAESSAEAELIHAIARDACQRLNIKWIPEKVSWAEVYLPADPTNLSSLESAFYQDVPGDHPVMFRDTLYVAPSMKGKLQPEEWRPIVAASMIYYAMLNTKRTLGIALRVISVLLLVGLGLFALLLAGIGFWPFIELLLFAVLGVTLAVFLLVTPYKKGLWLMADRVAADYVGPQFMLGVLEKVQEFHITELEGGRMSDKPSLAQRIDKLKHHKTTSFASGLVNISCRVRGDLSSKTFR